MYQIISLSTFQRAIKKILTTNDIDAIAKILQENPKAGDVIKGTGGVRKLRFATHKGKSSGARIIYFFLDSNNRIFLITAYTKNNKDNLTQSEVNELKKLVDRLKGV